MKLRGEQDTLPRVPENQQQYPWSPGLARQSRDTKAGQRQADDGISKRPWANLNAGDPHCSPRQQAGGAMEYPAQPRGLPKCRHPEDAQVDCEDNTRTGFGRH
ncbi:hypothetical protein N7456_011083 [Penicillium angulare]|uniref:Uncharacterized protein n=1 Tax=Penicillium angulare TaxID=116970 RepID=A0A9W9K0D6_9EURO|nr:hypothetical protein N7456_011083 [Penicillium angulare]